MMEPVILKSNEYWGRRSGKYVEAKPKGCALPWGFCFQQQQFGSGRDNSKRPSQLKVKGLNPKWFRK